MWIFNLFSFRSTVFSVSKFVFLVVLFVPHGRKWAWQTGCPKRRLPMVLLLYCYYAHYIYSKFRFCSTATVHILLLIFCPYADNKVIIIIIIIIFLRGLGRLTCSGIDALPSFPGASTVSSSSRFVVEGVFRGSGDSLHKNRRPCKAL